MSRIIQLPKRSGFYVEISVPLWVRKLGVCGNTVLRKAGTTRAEAGRNALGIEQELQKEWDHLQEQLEENHLLKKAKGVAERSGADLDEVVEQLMQDAGMPLETRNAVMTLLTAPENQLKEQERVTDGTYLPFKTPELDPKTHALVDGLNSGTDPWQEWVRIRKIEERSTAASRLPTGIQS